MSTAGIREQLQAYIASADDEKVRALYLLLETDMLHELPLDVSEEDWREIDKERQAHKRGEGVSYPAEEVMERLEAGRAQRHAA